jgi:hypothetical protein
MQIRTWQLELVWVAMVMAVMVLVTQGGWIEVVGAGAVLLSFAHIQVADRLAEREARRPVATVACHAWAARYLVGKEVLWLAYFVAHRSWSALVGVVLFIAYPLWRKTWRRLNPLKVEQ